MAAIFLSYRRADGPQASRVYEWLTRRFGEDAVFMDVSAIPFAVDFTDFIQAAIENSGVLLTLIGPQWGDRIHEADDPVRMEIETAIRHEIPILPVLVGNTPMPDDDALPQSIASIAFRNAVSVGVLNDFHTHMQSLLPKIEMILGTLAPESVVTSRPDIINRSCLGIIRFLRDSQSQSEFVFQDPIEWMVVGARDFQGFNLNYNNAVTLFLHRVTRLEESLELHFILSFWALAATLEHMLAGLVISQLERMPVIPDEYLDPETSKPEQIVTVRRSDEDARQVWKMITDQPLRLSLTYVATLSPRNPD